MAGRFIEINGHPTWVDDRAPDTRGSTVLLLHGGLSHSDGLLEALGPALDPVHRVVAFDRRGHGRTGDRPEPFHYAAMADETVAVIETVIGAPTHLIGHSDGGIVSMLVALRRPDLVDRLVLVGSNFHHEGVYPLDIDAESEVMAAIIAEYAARSPDGVDHFEEVAKKFMVMSTTEPTLASSELADIAAPTLIMSGDDDLITLSHIIELFEALPTAQLAVVPGTSHMVLEEQPETAGAIIANFLVGPAVPDTLMPVRRKRS